MPVVLDLEHGYPKLKGGRNASAEWSWKIFGASGWAEAYAALYAAVIVDPGLTFFTGLNTLTLQSLDAEPIVPVGPTVDVWQGKATYGIDDGSTGNPNGPDQEPGDPPVIDWDTQGATEHLTQAIAQRDYGWSGETPPSFDDAIGVTADGVEGVDVPVPHFKWSEKYTFDASFADFAYAKTIVQPMTGATNSAPFRQFAPLEVTFLGARGTRKGYELVEVTYQFEAGRTVTNQQIGSVEGVLKFGSEYLWTTYVEDKRGTPPRAVKIPKSVHVAQVKPEMDFIALGIGD